MIKIENFVRYTIGLPFLILISVSCVAGWILAATFHGPTKEISDAFYYLWRVK